MLSIRQLHRSVVRHPSLALSWHVAPTPLLSARPFSSLRSHAFPSSYPTTSQAPKSSQLIQSCRAFSSISSDYADKIGEVDAELVAKLLNELSLERSMRPEASSTPGDEAKTASTPSSLNADVSPPPAITDFLANTPWTVTDVAGQEQVSFERTYGNETIRVAFSIADLNELGEEPTDEEEDMDTPGLYDEPMEEDEKGSVGGAMEAQQGGAQSKGSVEKGSTRSGNALGSEGAAAENEELAEEDEEMDEQRTDGPSFPVRLTITITKPSLAPDAVKSEFNPANAALQILAETQDGNIAIENVSLYRDSSLANPETSENLHQTEQLYTGPPFANLDDGLQLLFDRYLEERGIDTQLALIVGEYVDWKEQREYVGWLEGLSDFVEA